MNKLNFGVGRADITPEIGGNLYGYTPHIYSESVNDPLHAIAFVFKTDSVTAIMITCDVCLIKSELSDKIRKCISEKYNVAFDNILLSATHTHSGPNTAGELGWGEIDKKYCDEIFVPGILSATEKAFNSIIPVKMGRASGNSYIGVNRRELKEDNSIDFGQQPWGCFNPKMTVLSFCDENEKVVANIIHYGAHGTCAGSNHKITRDWSGLMVDCIETVSGGITAFFNGPEGDVGPRLSHGGTAGGDIPAVEEIGKIAAADALKIYNTITEYSDVEVKCISDTLKIPYNKRISYEEALEGSKRFDVNSVNIHGRLYRYYNSVLKSYEDNYREKEYCDVPQSVIQIGNEVFVSFQYELFSEIGMRIDKAVEDKNVHCLSNTNGSESYFSTQDQLCYGGYEVTMFKTAGIQAMVDNADWYLMKETVRNIKNIK